MKIRYEFVKGEAVEVEVTDALGAQIAAMEKEQYNRDRAETRRHSSFDAMLEDGYAFSDGLDIAQAVGRAMEYEALREAVDRLEPDQKRLLQMICLEKYSFASIARDEGVTEGAIRSRLERILKKLKKSFE